MVSKSNKDYNLVIQKTATSLGIPEYEVWKVIRSVCKHIRKLIEAGEYCGFYMRALGKFYVKSKRIENLKKKDV